ncbi:MAG: hypothetical protein WBC13_00470, partial [Dokdonella sp.]
PFFGGDYKSPSCYCQRSPHLPRSQIKSGVAAQLTSTLSMLLSPMLPLALARPQLWLLGWLLKLTLSMEPVRP